MGRVLVQVYGRFFDSIVIVVFTSDFRGEFVGLNYEL